MKIKTSFKVEQFHEVELPHYRSIPNKQFFYKIISETECIEVWTKISDTPKIGINYASMAFLIDGHFEITKEEFDVAYSETLGILNSKI